MKEIKVANGIQEDYSLKLSYNKFKNGLGLPHVFQDGSYAGDHTFYHGYTENYMDYSWQGSLPVDSTKLRKGFYSSGNNKFKGKIYSIYK